MVPKTTAQNILLWCGALALAVLLSFLSGIATHWPEAGPIDWRGVWLDVIQTIVTALPLVAAGLGLPRIGKEAVASLVSSVGRGPAQAALEVEAIKQATGTNVTLTDADIGRIADWILEKNRERQIEIEAEQNAKNTVDAPADHIIGLIDQAHPELRS